MLREKIFIRRGLKMGSWDCENYICPKVTKRKSIIGHRMANSCEGVLRGQQLIISKI